MPGTAFRESCNRLQYGTLRPPAYDLTRVTAPTVYFLGTNDGKDVQHSQPMRHPMPTLCNRLLLH